MERSFFHAFGSKLWWSVHVSLAVIWMGQICLYGMISAPLTPYYVMVYGGN